MTPLAALDRLDDLAEKATPGPYYVALDDALECGPHRNSGLSLVDTGRQSDWPIARLCETSSANLIAALDPATVQALVGCVQAAIDIRNSPVSYDGRKYAERQVSHADVEAFDAALAKLTTTITKD